MTIDITNFDSDMNFFECPFSGLKFWGGDPHDCRQLPEKWEDMTHAKNELCLCGHRKNEHNAFIDGVITGCSNRTCSCMKFEPLHIRVLQLKALLKETSLLRTQVMLKILGDHFTEKTRIMAVPPGTKNWPYFKDEETVWIPMYEFFGLVVGYDIATDVLVMWKP